MIVKGIGVDLRRMSAVDAEQVRQWRNSSVLQSYLHHPKQISYEQQQAWFQTLDKERNYHFIIVYNGADVGFCSIKNLDVEQQSGEPGIFIVDETQLSSPLGVAVLITLLEFGYQHLGICNYYGHVLKSNVRAYTNYQAIGAEIIYDESAHSVMLALKNYSPEGLKIIKAKNLLERYFGTKAEVMVLDSPIS
jgi:RimJ/RimL family protein N-acetyltransferase